jgi:hypothetical protein
MRSLLLDYVAPAIKKKIEKKTIQGDKSLFEGLPAKDKRRRMKRTRTRLEITKDSKKRQRDLRQKDLRDSIIREYEQKKTAQCLNQSLSLSQLVSEST